jgi:hypothetical protein
MDGANLYEFVGSDPANQLDPLGLDGQPTEPPAAPDHGRPGPAGPRPTTAPDGQDGKMPRRRIRLGVQPATQPGVIVIRAGEIDDTGSVIMEVDPDNGKPYPRGVGGRRLNLSGSYKRGRFLIGVRKNYRDPTTQQVTDSRGDCEVEIIPEPGTLGTLTITDADDPETPPVQISIDVPLPTTGPTTRP